MSDTCANGEADAAYVSVSELNSTHKLYTRLQELQKFYCSQFGAKPQFFARVPGRVNIIGEHVDYCGYPVLPMAIDQCILLAVGYSAEQTLLQLRNVEGAKFENFKCELKDLSIELPRSGGPEWYKYYLCGVKGIYETIGLDVRPIGMTVALSGNIPPASGLSSSSALVSAAVLATAYVHRVPLERKRLAAISASCERYIGTQGGGMDQAIAYLARAGCAQFIEFHPQLNAMPIKLPEGACFVVANSLAEMNKAASSDFNERVVECRLASQIIAKRRKLEDWRNVKRFARLQQKLECNLSQLEQLVFEYLPQPFYTCEQICEELEVDQQELQNDFLTTNTRCMTKFKLRQRALHVIQESMRVQKFREICEHSSETGPCNGFAKAKSVEVIAVPPATKLATLSQLMRQSHHSLKELYECSHPDLDQLVTISDAAGVGARLTGAGWGGCIVALCDSAEASEKYIRELKQKYFLQLPPHIVAQRQQNDFDDVVFATVPHGGAEILTVLK